MDTTLKLAEINVKVNNISAAAVYAFREYIADEVPDIEIDIAKEDVDELERLFPPEWERIDAELAAVSGKVSDAMLPFGRAVFHGAAFKWNDRAWILTAPSGIGKTTQYAQWKLLYGDDVMIINGDKPLIEAGENGVVVHPSPWQGKEGIGNMESAPLGGIICLSQGKKNSISMMSPEYAVQMVFRSFLYSARNEEMVYGLGRIEEKMLRQAPVWALSNIGDPDSARLTHDTLLKYLEEENEI